MIKHYTYDDFKILLEEAQEGAVHEYEKEFEGKVGVNFKIKGLSGKTKEDIVFPEPHNFLNYCFSWNESKLGSAYWDRIYHTISDNYNKEK